MPGAAPRGPKTTNMPVVAHVKNVSTLLDKTRGGLLADLSFWDHAPPPHDAFDQQRICLWLESREAPPPPWPQKNNLPLVAHAEKVSPVGTY